MCRGIQILLLLFIIHILVYNTILTLVRVSTAERVLHATKGPLASLV